MISQNGQLANKPTLSFKGLPVDEKEEFIYNLEDEIENTCKTFSLKNKKQEQSFIETLKINCRKFIKEKTGKKPFTNINLVRL